jgi:hypothetical protein
MMQVTSRRNHTDRFAGLSKTRLPCPLEGTGRRHNPLSAKEPQPASSLTIAIIRPFSFYARFSTGFAKSIEPKKQERVKVMKIVTLFVGALLLVGSLGTGTAFGAAPGVIYY